MTTFFDQNAHDAWEDEPRVRRKRRPAAVVFTVLGIVLLVILGIVAYYAGTALNAFNGIDRDESLNAPDYQGRPEPAPTKDGKSPVNFVLMGSDSRDEDYAGRTDSLMMAHLSGDRQHLYLISFPRDMWVEIPGHGKGKINWAYAKGGAPLTIQTLEDLTTVRMDHTVAIDFEGFIQLTDALGGVTVHNPWATEQGSMTFPEGEITISGKEALAYVRQRKQLPNGDLDRAYRQRSVVKAIIRDVLSSGVLTNPAKFTNVVNTFADSLTVDNSLDLGRVSALATEVRFDDPDSVRLLQAPIKGVGTVGDQSVVVVDQENLALLSKALQDDTMGDYYNNHYSDQHKKLPDVEVDE